LSLASDHLAAATSALHHAGPHGSCRTSWIMQNCAERGTAALDAYKQGDKRGCMAEDILAMGFSMVIF